MRYLDDRNHLRVEIHTKECAIPADELVRMQSLLMTTLGAAVKDFPESELLIKIIFHSRSDAYHVQLKLKLPGKTLATSEEDTYLDAAFQRGSRKLVRRVEEYQELPDLRATEVAGHRKALDQDVVAPEDPSAGPLAEVVRKGDYRAFRAALAGYEEWLRHRVGRWVQRYPEAEARVGGELLLGDLVEEVYLSAFERFPKRPTTVRFSEWLDSLIDPSLKALLRHPDEERENASMVRTVCEAPLEERDGVHE
jgi:hypothetical protein